MLGATLQSSVVTLGSTWGTVGALLGAQNGTTCAMATGMGIRLSLGLALLHVGELGFDPHVDRNTRCHRCFRRAGLGVGGFWVGLGGFSWFGWV